MLPKPPKQTNQIDEKTFVYSRQGRETIEVGVLIPSNVALQLSEDQIQRLVTSFIVELTELTLGQDKSGSQRAN